jgi:tetratricopeptide (TPR) repeat protein
MSQRLDTLKSLIEQDPGNSRYRYMLAMELINSGDADGAYAAFQELIGVDPAYSAAYYHGGQTLEKLSRAPEARQMYLRGIEACTKNGDAHTRSELQEALDMLGG